MYKRMKNKDERRVERGEEGKTGEKDESDFIVSQEMMNGLMKSLSQVTPDYSHVKGKFKHVYQVYERGS